MRDQLEQVLQQHGIEMVENPTPDFNRRVQKHQMPRTRSLNAISQLKNNGSLNNTQIPDFYLKNTSDKSSGNEIFHEKEILSYTLDDGNSESDLQHSRQHRYQQFQRPSSTPPQYTPPLQYDEEFPQSEERYFPQNDSLAATGTSSVTYTPLSTPTAVDRTEEPLVTVKKEVEDSTSPAEAENLICQRYVQLDKSNILPNNNRRRYLTRGYYPPAKKRIKCTVEDLNHPEERSTDIPTSSQRKGRLTAISISRKSSPSSMEFMKPIKVEPSARRCKHGAKMSNTPSISPRLSFQRYPERETDNKKAPAKVLVKTTQHRGNSESSNSIRRSTSTATKTGIDGSENCSHGRDAAYPVFGNIDGCSPQISVGHLVVSDILIGEGQFGAVYLATYKGVEVACKMKRDKICHVPFEVQAVRELQYAAKLSVCRYVNRYIGWAYCRRQLVEESKAITPKYVTSHLKPRLYIVQKYVSNGDARNYLNKRTDLIQPHEVLQAAICLFSTLVDAHNLNIGLVDLKLENFLIDSSGSGWVTDFGSCIEFEEGQAIVKLDEEGVSWTKNVAAPEMLKDHEFCKASDVFMATLIIAELITAELSDSDFYHQILGRNRSNGRVSFSSDPIDKKFQHFFRLLQAGLSNEPSERPTADDILKYLLKMRL